MWKEIRAFVTRQREAFVAASPWERARLVLMALAMLFGIFLRARGQLWSVEPLWLDEASGAHDLLGLPLREMPLRPLGFLALTKNLAHFFGPSEPVLRALPWAAGVASVCLSPLLAARLYSARGARLLFVVIIALHPAAIDLSKEFKPYSISLFLHLVLALLALRYADERRTGDLAWALAFAIFGTFYAQDIAFAYPGFFLLLLGATRGSRPHRSAVLAGGALTVAVLVGEYFFLWRTLSEPAESAFWGDKYGVFHRAGSGSYLGWWYPRQLDLFAFAGYRRAVWRAPWPDRSTLRALAEVDRTIWVALVFAGLVTLALGRRRREALVLVLPLVALFVVNALGHWPFGVFRTNLFALLPSAGLAAMALDRPLWQRERLMALPSLLLVLVPLFAFDRRLNDHKRVMCHSSGGPELLAGLLHAKNVVTAQRVPLLIDISGCRLYDYYRNTHPGSKGSLGPALEANFVTRCFKPPVLIPELLRTAKERPGPLFVLDTSSRVKKTIRAASPFYDLTERHQLRGQVALGFRQRRMPERPPARKRSPSQAPSETRRGMP